MNKAQIAMVHGRTFSATRRRFAVLCILVVSFAVKADENPLFWSVNDSQGQRGHLIGTIHSEDPRVLDFAGPLLEALGASQVFAMELVPDLTNLAALAERMQLPPESSLETIVGPQRLDALQRALGRYGVTPAQVDRMQPWAAMLTLSVPPAQTGLFMDFALSLRASGRGVKVVGLETLDEQLAFLEGMSPQQQLALLDHAIAESPRVQQVHDEMIAVYLANDLGELFKQALASLEDLEASVRDRFLREGIEARNRHMLENMLPLLGQGGAFIAVGALHLPGESGLLELLRQQGYRLEPAGWPFIESP